MIRPIIQHKIHMAEEKHLSKTIHDVRYGEK